MRGSIFGKFIDVGCGIRLNTVSRRLTDKRESDGYLFEKGAIEEAESHMANRSAVLYLGGLVEVSDGKEMFRNPRHPYTQMLREAVPDWT